MSQQAVTTRPATDQRIDAALRLVFSRLPPGDAAHQLSAALESIKAGRGASLLREAICGQALIGASLAIVFPGRCGLLYPPRCIAAAPANTAGELLSACLLDLKERDVQLAQVSLATDNDEDRLFLISHGFQELATLSYLAAPAACFPTSQPAGDLRFVAASRKDDPVLMSIIDQTYEQTLDCPALNGVRDASDVLEGYRQTGVHAEGCWFLVYDEAQTAIGCLLLTDHPAADQWELMYMGVIPEARGRAGGQQMVEVAQWSTLQAGRGQLVLAVDELNDPAIGIYTRAGFRCWDRRTVLIKSC